MVNKVLVGLAFLLLGTAAMVSLAQASETAPEDSHMGVVIMPFTIYGKYNLSGFRRELLNALAAGIEESGKFKIGGIEKLKTLVLKEKMYSFDEASASMIGKEEGAAFAILGSMTKIDKTISLDIRLLDIAENRLVTSLYLKEESEKTVLESLKSFTGKLVEKMITAKSMMQKPEVEVAAKSRIISNVIITGNKRVDEAALKTKMKSKTGGGVSPEDVRDDIKAIYDMGFFEDVMADIKDTDRGKELTFIVKERPVIKKIIISGNKEIKDEKINSTITVKENTILNRTLLTENAEKIQALYATEGFFLASVEPVVERKDDVTVEVRFTIKEGDKVKVKRITIIGSKAYGEGDIKNLMDTKETGFLSFVTKSGIFDEAMFQNDLNKIMAHYYDNGYLHASITDHLVSLSSDKKWFFITIAISEGEQYKVGKIDIKGDILTTRALLMENIKTTTGEIFRRKTLIEDITKLSDIYGDEGYANVNIDPITDVDEKEKMADLTFDIHKGELVYVEKINISGNVNTRDKVIRREVELSEGTLFSATSMRRSRNNLNRLGYFDVVNIVPQQGSSENRMVLNVDVKERPTGSISAGIGYSSVDSLIGTASISQSNFLGTGLKLDLSGNVSSASSRFQFGITEPWLFDKPISAGFDLFNVYREYPNFARGSYGFDVRFGFPIYTRDTRGYLTYKLEEVTVSNVAQNAAQFILNQQGKRIISSLSSVIKRDTRDDAFFPRNGSVTTLTVELAGGPIGGDNNFVKYIAEGVRYFPLFWDTTFAIHGIAGSVDGFGGKAVPVFERFYLGGINSIRGFRIRSVGPRDPATNDYIGGDKELYGNLEYIFPLMTEQKVRGLVFFDAGNAYDGAIDFGNVRRSVGTGIRWFSPVGPLRLEWGYNLDRREGEPDSLWEFTIGTLF